MQFSGCLRLRIHPFSGQRAVVHFQHEALDFAWIATGGFSEDVAVNVLAEHVVLFVFRREADGLPLFAIGNNLPIAKLQGNLTCCFARCQPPAGFAPFVHAFQLALAGDIIVNLVLISVSRVTH